MVLVIYLLSALKLYLCWSMETKSPLTLDDFFDNTHFLSLSFSSSGQHLLFQTTRPAWNSSSSEYNLWLYDIETQKKKLITKTLGEVLTPYWSPSGNWFAYLRSETSTSSHQWSSESDQKTKYYIYLYSILTDDLWPIQINIEAPSMLRWSDNDSSLYIVATTLKSTGKDEETIFYRQRINNQISIIHRVDIDSNNRSSPINQITTLTTIPFRIGELLYVPLEQKLIFTSVSALIEDLNDFEIYSIDLRNVPSLTRLTNNQACEIDLELSNDGKYLLFRNYTRRSNQPEFNDTQRRLYSLDLIDGQTERLGKDFMGNIIGYTPKSDGGVYILGQLRTEIQIYTQQSAIENSIHQSGWNGTYENLAVSLHRPNSIAFIYSSFEQPKELYYIHDINQLQSAQAITNENYRLTQREIPKAKVYNWKNEEDQQIIEGILHYPPGKFQSKNLPLLVLMHGGPYEASLNDFQASWYNWAPLAATQGWLVLEPNYCGSAGYGDQFVDEIRRQPFTRPTRDILSAVDQLIKDGIVDSTQLAVGGYNYGGFLTNWLIRQTTRFNAALSGAGAVDHASAWGTMDLPILFNHLFGGPPWDASHIYLTQSPMYQLDKVRTPTLIVTGGKDTRVDTEQSYMLERGLHYLGIPVKLIVFPNEEHGLDINPWHGKIKVREELKWLMKYGLQSGSKNNK